MRPLDAHTVEQQLRDAIHAGDENEIMRLGMLLDELAPPKRPPSLAAAALWYAEQGLHIFPLKAGSKMPHPGSHGCHDATNDPAQIRAWWNERPDSNIGLATGHMVDVVDIDGPKGQQSMYRNWALINSLHVLATVSTPRPGGLHYYVPAAGRGNKAGLLEGIDYRGSGGYVVAPPSVNEQGRYEFLGQMDVSSMKVAA